MRIVSWNILQGGGRRCSAILDTLAQLDADVVALQEYRHGRTSRQLLAGFSDLGFDNQLLPEPEGSTDGNRTTSPGSINTVGLLSRYPIDGKVLLPAGVDRVDAPLALRATITIIDKDVVDIDLVVVHLPHKRKQLPYFETLLGLPADMRAAHSLLIGDFNCGIPFEDSETKSFPATRQFQTLLSQGWVDAWRRRNPQTREFTWISSRKGNGFRYDHALVSSAFDKRIRDVRYEHSPREQGISDHSVLVIDID